MNASVSSLFNPLKSFIDRYHPTIFFTMIGLLLAAGIFMLYQILQIPGTADGSEATPTVSSQFSRQEKDTIKQIQQLRESSESGTTLTFPTPRSNPFIE